MKKKRLREKKVRIRRVKVHHKIKRKNEVYQFKIKLDNDFNKFTCTIIYDSNKLIFFSL